jgi:general stress protein 26
MEPEVRVEPSFIHHAKGRAIGEPAQSTDEARARIAEGIRRIRTCMLTTVTPEGHLESTPMTTQELDAEGNLWFFVGTDADSTLDIDREENVNLAYSSPREFEFISIAGIASVVYDRTRAERLWNPSFVSWFPKGIDDPNLALLKVRILNAEYWETAASRPLRLFGIVRALFTGEPFDVGIDHQKVRLN